MSTRDPSFDAYVMKIHSVLDRLDYYRLLGVSPTASPADVKKTFYAIAKRFHPDRNRDASDAVYNALYDIYKRINEAYRVLMNPEKRERYNEVLKSGVVRLVKDTRTSGAPRDPVDTIAERSTREFYQKAKEELSKGNLGLAELHIKMAVGREPRNEAIRELVAEILRAKAAKQRK